jgi:MraZ protein
MESQYGNFERSLDSKGRLILPAKLRAAFGETAFLTSHPDGCLAVYDDKEMEKQEAAMLRRAKASQDGRNLVRVWAFYASEVTFDAQGRIPIPPKPREWAGLEEEVLVLGVIDRVELWSPERYAEKIAAANLELLEGTNL